MVWRPKPNEVWKLTQVTNGLADAKPSSPYVNTVLFLLYQADLMNEQEKASALWSFINATTGTQDGGRFLKPMLAELFPQRSLTSCSMAEFPPLFQSCSAYRCFRY